MSDGIAVGILIILICVVLSFIVLTISSPILIAYGFFSTKWMILDKDQVNQTDIGLYKRCQYGECSSEVIDHTTFGLMVTSVLCLFLSSLALPWLKCCFPDNKYLKYWNHCFLPLLLISAILSFSASLYFARKYQSEDENRTTGRSVMYAGLGGQFQILLFSVITAMIFHHNGCCTRSTRGVVITNNGSPSRTNNGPPSTATKTEAFIVGIFYYGSPTTQAPNAQAQTDTLI